MDDLRVARQVLDKVILTTMIEGGAAFGLTENYYHLAAFETELIPREIARAILRDLTDRGLCHFRRGLFDEDGVVAGAGYGITLKGIAYHEELIAAPGELTV